MPFRLSLCLQNSVFAVGRGAPLKSSLFLLPSRVFTAEGAADSRPQIELAPRLALPALASLAFPAPLSIFHQVFVGLRREQVANGGSEERGAVGR